MIISYTMCKEQFKLNESFTPELKYNIQLSIHKIIHKTNNYVKPNLTLNMNQLPQGIRYFDI